MSIWWPDLGVHRGIPHPDTLVPGGPEIDFGIQTADTLILGEAKWLSGVGRLQGVAKENAYSGQFGHLLRSNSATHSGRIPARHSGPIRPGPFIRRDAVIGCAGSVSSFR